MVRDFFQLPDGRTARLYTLTNNCGMSLGITDFGGTIVNWIVPDRSGKSVDIVLGWKDPAEYLRNSCYFGALIGRCANRIGGGRFEMDGTTCQSILNDRKASTLHGGFGYSHRLWQLENYDENHLALTLDSPDGDAGFPGNLHIRAVYTLSDDANDLSLEFSGECDRATIVNLTNHSYFNLSGEASGKCTGHVIRFASDACTEVDANLVPTGKVFDVTGTPFDLRKLTPFEEIWRKRPGGFDDNMILGRTTGMRRNAVQARSMRTGIELVLDTDQPGVQFYMAGGLNTDVPGKCGRNYTSGEAFCIEPQGWPDAVNHPEFPSVRVEPGKPYHALNVYHITNF